MTLFDRPRCRIPHLAETADLDWDAMDALPVPDQRLWQMIPLDAPVTTVKAVATPEALLVRFECQLLSPMLLAPPTASAPIAETDHVWLRIYPQNRADRCLEFAGDFRGNRHLLRHHAITGEIVHGQARDTWQRQTALNDTSRYTYRHGVARDVWWGEYRLPWEVLDLTCCPAVVGLSYGRKFRPDAPFPPLDQIAWPSRSTTVSVDHGEALIGDRAGAPQSLSWEPCFGRQTASLQLGDSWPSPPKQVTITTPDDSQTVTVSGDSVELPVHISHGTTSHLPIFDQPVLTLDVEDADNHLLYHVELPCGRHLGLCLDEPYGQAADSVGDDREAWLERVVRRLPRLHRQHTGDGAPSDFCLVSEDGDIQINLMADNAWHELTQVLYDRFNTPADLIVGAMALIGQKSVTNLLLEPNFFTHSGASCYHSPAHELMGPLSIIRFGGGTAHCRAAVLAHLLRLLQRPLSLNRSEMRLYFHTRVVSLGTPSAAEDEPQRAAAVAIEWQDDFTLVDPTNFTFFPMGKDKLATLEELQQDERLLQAGAGPLAILYKGLSSAAIRRLPVDMPLSKGVFPELAANEIGPDRPFQPEQVDAPRILLANGPALGGFLDRFGRPGHRRGEVSVALSGHTLCVQVEVSGITPADLEAADLAREGVHLMLDLEHDHTHIRHVHIGLNGQATGRREASHPLQTLFKNLSSENLAQLGPWAPSDWSHKVDIQAAGYRVQVTTELPTIPPVIGLNVWLEGCVPVHEQVLFSLPRYRRPEDAFSFADVYLTTPIALVRKTDLGLPCWGANTANLVLENRSPEAQQLELCSTTQLSMSSETITQGPISVELPGNTTTEATLPCWIDPREKMCSDHPQTITIEVRNGRHCLYRASYRQGYCTAPGVYQRYGAAALPAGNDPLNQKIHEICRQLPQFERLTTRDGAASDFVIRSPDGLEFNFMAANVLADMANFIEARFRSPLDRVLGMFYLGYHPAIARHQSSGHRYNTGCGPLSLIRLNFAGGGGNCGFHARILAGLLNSLHIDGKRLQAHTLGIYGHVITGLVWRGSKTILDADVGHIFLTADCEDLATLEDIRSGNLATTAGPGELGRYLSLDDHYLLHYPPQPDDPFPGRFPPGAPP